MAVNGVEIKAGQKWCTRDGQIVCVESVGLVGDDYPVVGFVKKTGSSRTYTLDGVFDIEGEIEFDLVELIEDAPLTIAPPPEPNTPDANELAAETLQSLGWHFVGNCWVQENTIDAKAPSQHLSHPLYPVVVKAIEQAMFGKGERHGGNATPFLEQPWVHYAKMHGRGFLTGQAAKKLEEAASKRTGEAFETEVLGAMVYAGMAVLFERGEVK